MTRTLPRAVTRASGFALTLCWLAGAAQAEVDVAGARLSGELEVGGRAVTGEDWNSSSKYDEYREQDPGMFGSGSFLLENRTEPYRLRGWLFDVGEDDERYELEGGRWGLYRFDLEYSELPHVYSNDARSLYTESNGVLDFPNAFQTSLQALSADSAAQSALLGSFLADSPQKDLEFRLRTGRTSFEMSPREELDLLAGYSIQDRQGTKPFALGFGSPGGTFVNFVAPIEQQIHQVNAGARWSQDPWSLEAGYDGSFFEDAFHRLIVDNPLRATDDASAGSSRGRLSAPPDNSAHTFRLAGATRLPSEFPSRLAGSFAYGRRFQDESFLCHTINTALLATPQSCGSTGSVLDLPEDSLDGDVATFLGNLTLTARPTDALSLTARYRFYDFDNDSDEIEFPTHVVNDTSLVTETRTSVANEYRRQNAVLEAALDLTERATLQTGYEFEQWNRSDDREVTRLHEHRPNVALDVRLASWSQLRASYEFGVRRGNGYDQFAYFEESLDPAALTPDELSTLEFPELRKFDEADRISNRVDLLAQFTPRDDLAFTLTGSLATADYDNTDFGLESDESYSVGGDTAWQVLEWLGVSTWYTFENIRYEQSSRWRNVSGGVAIDDPVNNWWSLSKDQIHNLGFDLDLVLVPDRLDATLGYGIQHAVGKTNSSGAAGCFPGPPPAACIPAGTVADGGNAVNWPHLEDVLQNVHASLRYHVNEKLTVKGAYVFEKFDLTDFKTDDLDPFEPDSNVNGSGVVSPSRDVFLGARIEDYKAHVFALSLIYRF
jgi:MtrB/PioB family decaheme-associated outer membrane protein